MQSTVEAFRAAICPRRHFRHPQQRRLRRHRRRSLRRRQRRHRRHLPASRSRVDGEDGGDDDDDDDDDERRCRDRVPEKLTATTGWKLHRLHFRIDGPLRAIATTKTRVGDADDEGSASSERKRRRSLEGGADEEKSRLDRLPCRCDCFRHDCWRR